MVLWLERAEGTGFVWDIRHWLSGIGVGIEGGGFEAGDGLFRNAGLYTLKKS